MEPVLAWEKRSPGN